MKRYPGMDKKVEDALSSLDDMKRSEPGAWFYTKLKARLEREENTAWSTIGSFLSKPVVAFVTLGLILVLNGFFLFRQSNTEMPAAASVNSELNTDNEYVLASNSSYEFENIAQQ